MTSPGRPQKGSKQLISALIDRSIGQRPYESGFDRLQIMLFPITRAREGRYKEVRISYQRTNTRPPPGHPSETLLGHSGPVDGASEDMGVPGVPHNGP